MPFWFWNADLREEELLSQLTRIADMGCGGAFIHARFGLEGDYLGQRWFQTIRACCERAMQLGVHLWLYDENPFPSGIGGLQVTAHPEFRAKYLEAIAYPPGTEPDASGRVAVGHDAASGQVRAVYRRVLQPTNGKAFGPDYLNPEAMRSFIEMTHGAYEANLGEYFGTAIRGFFTDEPTLLPWHHDLRWYGLLENRRVAPWGDLLPDALEREGIGPDELGVCLLSLFDDMPESGRYRRTYWRCVARLYEESFAKPYARWCSQRGLLLTGHLLLEEGLYSNTLFEADPSAILGHFDMPGVDHLGADMEYRYGGFDGLPKLLTNVQGQKLVSSIAHTRGRARVLSETYGCAGWGLDLHAAKRVYDWQLCLGVNFLCPHAFFQSIEGYRKTDAPPCFLHNVSSRDFRLFADYVGRASFLLSQGTHVARIALWYPLEGFWSEYSPGCVDGPEARISQSFDMLCSTLTRLKYDYDIVDSAMLAGATTGNGQLAAGHGRYEALLIPETSWAPQVLGDLATRLELDGGLVIRAGDDFGPPALLACLSGVKPIAELQPPSLGVLAIARRLESTGEYVCFLFNSSDEGYSGTVRIPDCPGCDGWTAQSCDLELGHTTEVPCGDGLSVELSPFASLALVMSPATVPVLERCDICPQPGRELQNCLVPVGESICCGAGGREPQPVDMLLGPRWLMSPLDDNVLPLDSWTTRMKSSNCWESYSYETTVFWQGEGLPERLSLLLDDIEYREAFMGSMDIRISINGEAVGTPLEPSPLDPRFRLADLSAQFVQGANRMEILIRHSAWSGQPRTMTSIPKLLGSFHVGEAPEGLGYPPLTAAFPQSVLPASWTHQGYPYYSGTMRYSTVVSCPPGGDFEACELIVAGPLANSMRVAVGGVHIGSRAWPPWRVELPVGMMATGSPVQLDIEVTNTSQNMLEGVARESGLLGPALLRFRVRA